MALPKEPRQKMINMMYLVLTALLALNVSVEIINAFKTVNNSLNRSNTTLSAASDKIYQALAESKEDPKTREKANIWAPKAEQVKQLSAEINNYMEGLKNEMMKGSGYDPAKGDTVGWEQNLDAATRIMDTKGEGENLRKKLDAYKAAVLAIDPDIAKKFANTIPINTEIPKSSAGNTNQDWTQAYFHMAPTIAACTIVSKFQNDVKNTENKVASFCLEQIGAVKIIFDKFVPLISTSSNYLMPGDNMEVTAGLGAFNATVKPEVYINGQKLPVSDNGVAETKFPGGASGSHSFDVLIKYVDPSTGEIKEVPKKVEYTVGQSSGVSVSPDKMLVLYVGVDNPLTITAGAGSEKVSASITSGTISKVNGPHYIAKPAAPGDVFVNVNVEGKPAGKVGFRVKYLPPPSGMVGNLEGGQVSTAQFKAMGGVRAVLQNSEFDAQFEVLSYTIADLSNPDYNPLPNNGPRWVGAAGNMVNGLRPGKSVYIDNIKARGPDGRTVTLKPLSYILR
ncbi:MAG: gliding motility protein GldM [Bacteroidetes bacterium]|nr:MAG: gliding motility protein GldM [Bacteroidota bacterium]